MDSLTQAKADTKSYVASLRYGQTWIMSFLYIGTFGSFIGFSFALPLVIKNTFPEFLADHPFIATYLGGPRLHGRAHRLAVRGRSAAGCRTRSAAPGSRWRCSSAWRSPPPSAIVGVQHRSFAVFFGSYMVIFLLAGMGNGSTYKMIPSIFALLGREDAEKKGSTVKEAAVEFKRRAAAVIGIAGAIGAFGGVLIQVVLRQASLEVSNLVKAATTPAEKVAVAAAHADWSVPALWVFLGSYVVFAGVTWSVYLRPSFAKERSPPRWQAHRCDRSREQRPWSSPATAWSATSSSRRCSSAATPRAGDDRRVRRGAPPGLRPGRPQLVLRRHDGRRAVPRRAGRVRRDRACTSATRSRRIDRDAGTVVVGRAARVVAYDALVLATGSYPFVPPVPGHDLPGCFVYRTIDDLEAIRDYAAGRRVGAVVGGGLLGLEAANALRNLGLETHVVEFAPALMPVQVDDGGGAALRARIEELGVHGAHVDADHRARRRRRRPRRRRCASPTATTSTSTSSCSRPASVPATSWPAPAGSRSASAAASSSTTRAAPPIRASTPSASARSPPAACGAWSRPGYDMARVVADRLARRRRATFTGADLSTKLKLLGVDVASFGDAFGATPGAEAITFDDPVAQGLQAARRRRRRHAGARRHARRRRVRVPDARCRWPGATCRRPSTPSS